MGDEHRDKANWTDAQNNTTFCELCVEQIREGNRVNGHMTGRGFKIIAEKFYLSTGLRHNRIQLKNRWGQLKGLYNFWLWCNKQKGLGRANGTVVADEEWWKKHTKVLSILNFLQYNSSIFFAACLNVFLLFQGHSEWKKLKLGPPENLEHLEQMFEHTAIDGSSSCIPGEQKDGD
jgi:hypothetical protein